MIDLYRLLELPPLEADAAKIEAALNRCLKTAERAGDVKTKSRLKRLFELGSQHLLPPAQKRKYDQQWRAEFATHSVLSDASDNSGIASHLLPAGDPRSDFDLAAYLESSSEYAGGSFEKEYLELMSAIEGSSSQHRSPQFSNADSSIPRSSVTSKLHSPAGPPNQSTVPLHAGADRTSAGRRSSKSLAGKLRNKSDHSLMMIAAGLLLSVAVVLAVILVVTNYAPRIPDAGPTNRGGEQLASQTPRQAANEGEQATKTDAPRGSGLPQLKLPADSTDVRPPEPQEPKVETEVGSVIVEQMKSQTTVAGNMDVGPQSEKPSDTEESQPLSPDEQKIWQDGLNDLRTTIASQRWADAQQKLDELLPTVKTPSQRQEHLGLQSALELLQQADDALRSAIQSLAGGDMLQVRSTTLAFVEADDQKLILRIDGQNQSFSLDQLPVGILEALLDLQLDSVNRRAQAAKAAYIMLYSQGTELVVARLEKSLREAEEAEIIATTTQQALQSLQQ